MIFPGKSQDFAFGSIRPETHAVMYGIDTILKAPVITVIADYFLNNRISSAYCASLELTNKWPMCLNVCMSPFQIKSITKLIPQGWSGNKA